MNDFIDKYGYKITVEECKEGVEINISGKGSHMFAVLNKYYAEQLGKAIINASGGLKL